MLKETKTIREFAEEVAAMLKEKLAEEGMDVNIQVSEIMKLNDQKLYGLAINTEDGPAPTFYINEVYEACQHGADLQRIICDLADAYADATEGPMPTETPDLTFESVLKRASLRVVGEEYNKEYLKTVPYREVGFGYVLLAELQIGASDGGVFTTIVTNAMAEENDYDMKRLFDAVLENAASVEPPTFQSMSDVIGEALADDNTYVLTTQRQKYGAAAFFYPGVQEMIADELGEGYYAIPSSCHEFLIIRESNVPEPEKLADMVIEANRYVVAQEDLLSSCLLHYSNGVLERAVPETEAFIAMPQGAGGVAYAS